MIAKDAYLVKFANEIFSAGDFALFSLNFIKNDEYHSSIYQIDSYGNTQQLTYGEHEKNAKFIDGRLFYIRHEKERDTLMELSAMKEPREIVSFHKIKDYLLIKGNMFVIGLEDSDNSLPFAADKIKYRYNARGLIRKNYALYTVGKEVKKIYSGRFDVNAIASNNNRILIETTENMDDYDVSDLYEIDNDGIVIKRITEEPASINGFAISEHGRIAFSGHYGIEPWKVSKIIFPEEKTELMVGNDADNSIISDSFSSSRYKVKFYGDTLYAIGHERSSSFVFRIGEKIEKLTPDHENIIDFDVNKNLAYIYSTHKKPSIVNFVREYDINENIKGAVPDTINVDEGEEFALIRSPDSPSILFIHGGPHSAYGHTYFIEFQYFYENGYNILFANPPGSTGYGQEYEKACVGDWGGNDLKFLQKFLKTVKEKYKLTGKIGVTGGSYGGFMTNWIVTHDNEFDCAISERSISNLFSMVGTSDIGFWFNAMELGIKDPYEKSSVEKLMAYSPIMYIKNVKTPTMLITGEEDYRCPIEQAEQFFVALKLNNVDTELVRYMGDNHEHARAGVPKNMVDRLERKLAWFDKYLKN
ncbi:MAG: S9 family peptidase [Thermoplasmata archaeon]